MWPSIPVMVDFARFDALEDEAVVAAAFACPFCLRASIAITVRRSDPEFVAACRCRACPPLWRVYLRADQVARLKQEPPARLRIRWDQALASL
jgi:hypothetical protein